LTVFFAIEIDTLPSPLPLAPEAIVIHDVLLLADQRQPADVSTLIDLLPPSFPTFIWLGDTL
jgi:hypothetical protein